MTQTLALKGLTKTKLYAKIKSFEQAIAASLGVDEGNIKITNVEETVAGARKRRSLLQIILKITFEVDISKESSDIVIARMKEGNSTESSMFLKNLSNKLAVVFDKTMDDFEISSTPLIIQEYDSSTGKGVETVTRGYNSTTNNNAYGEKTRNIDIIAIIVAVFAFFCICCCLFSFKKFVSKKSKKEKGMKGHGNIGEEDEVVAIKDMPIKNPLKQGAD